MPLPDDAKLISVDDHVIEHPRVWQERLPQRFQEAGPRVVEVTEGPHAGTEAWLYEVELVYTHGVSATSNREESNLNLRPVRFDEMTPGAYDPKARVADMDIDGVQAQLCFSTFVRYAGTRFLLGKDKDLGLACVQAYNDFIIDEWCGYAPDRQIPLVVLPLWDRELCVAEIQRTAAKGAKAIGFPENPASPLLALPSWHSDHWEPVLAAAAAAGMPLCMHVGTSGATPVTSAEAPTTVTMTLIACNSMAATMDLAYSGVFVRHPDLKVMLSEGGIGWMPYMIERADRMWQRHKVYDPAIDHGVLPSEMIRNNIYCCFIDDDAAGIEMRHQIGITQITWESDYPHSDSSFPHSRKMLADALRDVSDDDARRIVELNAREVLHFDADL